MEKTERMDQNFTYSSCGDSRDSSPRSREIDGDNQLWDETQYRVKCMCSFGGRIQPRSHDNQLSYFGGDTKILAVDRSSKYAEVVSRLSQLWDTEVCFKYQLPGEELDALISVTNDEDLDHMMVEFDRLYNSNKMARLRLFLFPVESATPAPGMMSSAGQIRDSKPDQRWFVDALNAIPTAPALNRTGSSSSSGQDSQDFLFGLEKTSKMRTDVVQVVPPGPVQTTRVLNDSPTLAGTKRELRSPEMVQGQVIAGVHPAEIQRQIQEFQRMQIAANQEHQAAAAVMIQRKQQEENLSRSFPTSSGFPVRDSGPQQDYYIQKVQEKSRYEQTPPVQQQQVAAPTAPPVTTYWVPPTPDRNPQSPDQAVYVLPSAVYPSGGNMRPAFYAMQPKMQVAQPQPPPLDPYAGAKTAQLYSEAPSRPAVDPSAPFSHMVYEQGGRAVYYATQAPPPPQYHAVGVDLRQGLGQAGQDSGRNKSPNQSLG